MNEELEDVLDLIEDIEYDRNVLPHYGLVPDFYIRYCELRNAIINYVKTLK